VNVEKKVDQLLALADDIKRLIILSLLRGGASQADIGRALKINQSSVSRLFDMGPKPKGTKDK
jgi:hypothetical protein